MVEGLGEQVGEQMDGHATLTELLGEGVVLLSGPVGPHDVVEEQAVHVVGCQPLQLGAGPVHDHLAKPADLGVDME